ncbi:multidrug transporter subunit MdtN [Klebsiella aerogenes]|uniref:multidrug transporter subunit MdtN n=1 Tax=Klebsiella pneumoniae TaxID=573 RepID=UPI0036D50539|nr:multidrug transporter subunit MdtN [Klebsiella aerogenes]
MKENSIRYSKWLTRIMLLLALLSGLCVVWRLDTERTTDDAFVYADTVSIAPEISGRISELDVRENQYVKRGQLLFRIDPKEYLEQLQRSQASLLALNEEIKLSQRTVDAQKFTADSESATVRKARAVLEQSTASLNRIAPLYRSGTVSAQALDDARTRQQGAQAALESAVQKAKSARAGISGVEALIAKRAVLEADIALAQINLEDTEVRSPVDGLVTGLETTLGHYARTGSHIFSIIDAGRWYVVASFRETELTKIQPGMPVRIWLMSDTSRPVQGVVESVGYGVEPSEGTVNAKGMPEIPRSLNWVRVAQRFPVRIRLDNPPADLVRVGASAMVSVRGKM